MPLLGESTTAPCYSPMLGVIWQWWDVAVAVILVAIHRMAWESTADRKDGAGASHEERELGASTLSSAIAGGLTAVSILIPAAVLIAFQAESKKVSDAAVGHLLRAVFWFVFSLAVAMFASYQIPVRSHTRNVTKSWQTGGMCGIQFIFLTLGSIQMLLALLYRK